MHHSPPPLKKSRPEIFSVVGGRKDCSHLCVFVKSSKNEIPVHLLVLYSSKKLGIFGLKIFLLFPGSFIFQLVAPLHFIKIDSFIKNKTFIEINKVLLS